MIDRPLPGPLDEFLNTPPARAEPADLRRHVLSQTIPQLGRRRRANRIKGYVLAASTMVLLWLFVWAIAKTVDWFGPWEDRAAEQVRVQNPGQQPIPRERQPEPAPPLEKKQLTPGATSPQVSAIAMEWKAFDGPRGEKAVLYQQAGDRYIDDQLDLASAVRCYSQAVQTAQAKDLEIDPDDNWLVMALKLDRIERRKEK